MLSIIISSYQPQYFSNLEKNISTTCGIPYEIIKIDNPNLMGICEAYNKGAHSAKYQYLLFLHEDVIFETQNWGKILINKLSNKNIGIVGIAGGVYVPNVPCGWWEYPKYFRNFNQYDGTILLKKYSIDTDQEVDTLDGVFLACRYEIWQKFKFNNNIKGFHIYDTDFSIRVANEFQNIVVSDILINHYSPGNMDYKWMNSLIKYRKLYKAPQKQIINKQHEAFMFSIFKKNIEISNLSLLKKILLLYKYNNPKYIGKKKFLSNLFEIIYWGLKYKTYKSR